MINKLCLIFIKFLGFFVENVLALGSQKFFFENWQMKSHEKQAVSF